MFARSARSDLNSYALAKDGTLRTFPVIQPKKQVTDSGKGSYSVIAPRDPSRSTTLMMYYGDGTSESKSIAQGSGYASFTFYHAFNGTGTYPQRATIVETGAFATSTTTRRASPFMEVFEGKLTVWGVSQGSSGTVGAIGAGGGGWGTGNVHCAGSPSGQANIGPSGGVIRQIKLSVAVEQCAGGGGDGALPGGVYLVTYAPADAAAVRVGEFILPPDGAISNVGPFTVPGGAGGWGGIGISNVSSVYGNAVPVFLL